MGFFSFLFRGGNVGVIAKTLSAQYKQYPNFNSLLLFYSLDFKNRKRDLNRSIKAEIAIDRIKSGEIKNYTELAALALQVDAAPNSHSYEYVLNGFKAELMKRLLKDGVDADSVFGNVFVDWEKFNPSIKAS